MGRKELGLHRDKNSWKAVICFKPEQLGQTIYSLITTWSPNSTDFDRVERTWGKIPSELFKTQERHSARHGWCLHSSCSLWFTRGMQNFIWKFSWPPNTTVVCSQLQSQHRDKKKMACHCNGQAALVSDTVLGNLKLLCTWQVCWAFPEKQRGRQED